MGDVGQPGIRLMNHRMTVTEAMAEAGGVLSTGDKSKVVRFATAINRFASRQIPVNVSAIYKGKAPTTLSRARAIRSSCRKQDEEGQGVAGLYLCPRLRPRLRRSRSIKT